MFAEFLVDVLTLYVVLGVVFAIAFIARGISRIDTHAAGAGLAFRLIVFSGVAALWPLLLKRWIRVQS